MNKQDFKNLIDEQWMRIQALTDTKGEEYSQSDNQLANFVRQSHDLGIPPEVVIMVYLNKHLDSIRAYARGGYPESEPIEGRIDDAILYLLLLKAQIREGTDIAPSTRKRKENNSPWGWSVLEEAKDQPVMLEVAGRYFEMGFLTGTEHGIWSAQQLRSAMQRLTDREESSTHPHQ